METQERDNTPAVFWVQTERRPVADPGAAWAPCCVVETVLNDHGASVEETFDRHLGDISVEHRVTIWPTSKFTGAPVMRVLRLFNGQTEEGIKYAYQQEIPAPETDSPAAERAGEAPKAPAQPDSEDAALAGSAPILNGPTEPVSGGDDASAGSAEQGAYLPPSTVQMWTEDQLKRAAVELEEALRVVTEAQKTLARKGTWWCYQDALAAVAQATAVYTAAYLNWEALI